ncbi:type II secretion system protein GspE [Candidatus Peregrinibacteria bacterium HGW-Peregrinibacteria-1]|jgi:type IV pilus assembly protein PilB|nr:MAG: type II secretion system protein GspE [Candidatus Peregrinibacteria bacterium HGW-Peregrinibacteria-1]
MNQEENTNPIPFKQDSKTYQKNINREFQESATLKRAQSFDIPYINLSKTPLNPDFFKIIELETARSGRIIPFLKQSQKVLVAVEDPQHQNTIHAIDGLHKRGFEVIVHLASTASIDEALSTYDRQKKYYAPKIIEQVETESIKTYENEIKDLKSIPEKLATTTQEEGLNLIDIAAMKTGASDIHYEPQEKDTIVRFRIDGVLHEVFRISHKIYGLISSQIKYSSKMKLNINNVPQDGRYTFVFNKIKIAVRVSAIPTPYGESFVCRYLSSDRKALTFEELGFIGLQLSKLQAVTKISRGMVLVTGPTGSGKSTTLYSLLNIMKSTENKVITLEDPVEYYIDQVTQSQIDENDGYTFLSGLRSILRQDPDIIMLGEIRDLPTADTALQAALTGHVLLSTLHTNSAVETLPRLINMGIKSFMLAPAMHTVIGQRLVRKVCQFCSTKISTPSEVKEEYDKMNQSLKAINPTLAFETPAEIPQAHGCEKCSHTGYSGRLVVAEVLVISEKIRRLIMEGAGSIDIITVARQEGMTTMREDGYRKVAIGMTTLEEVHRVTNITI